MLPIGRAGTAGSCFSDIGRARCRRGSGAYPAPKPPRPSDLLSTPTLSERRLLILAFRAALLPLNDFTSRLMLGNFPCWPLFLVHLNERVQMFFRQISQDLTCPRFSLY